jgi:magnesium-transporting ATPase (P-type)
MDSAAIAKPMSELPAWHAVAADEVLRRLNTDPKKGLDTNEVSQRLSKYGPNRLPEGKKQGPFMRFLSQFYNILVYVLLAAGFVKLMVGLWLDAAIILGVVIINALLGFIQEGKAEKALDSIRNMLSADARTLRDGETRMVPAEDLVPGDIVLLESGDRIPADVRLVEVKNLRTEEAALTGESVPIDKSIDATAEKSTVGDREGMAFSGTLVASGRGTGLVVATGADTELGRINQMMTAVTALETPLLRQIKKFGYAITAVIGVVTVIIFAYGRWVRGMDFIQIFQAVVSIAVSIIPEGLPALITVTLAIGVQRMAQRHAIIRAYLPLKRLVRYLGFAPTRPAR